MQIEKTEEGVKIYVDLNYNDDQLILTVTPEGLIADLMSGGEVIETSSQTFEEFAVEKLNY